MKAFLAITILSICSQLSFAQLFVNHDAAGSNNGSSWENAFVDIQDALDAATMGEQIWIAAGTYKPSGPSPDSSHFFTITAIELYGGFAGHEGQLSERDWELNPTILSGDLNGDDIAGDFEINRDDNAHHVFYADITEGTIILDGITFEGGATFIDPPPLGVVDYKEHTPWHGGGALLYGTGVVRNCIFRNNDGYRGSGLFAYGNDHLSDDLYIYNCLFETNNSVQGGSRVGNFSDALVEECIFRNNISSNFGAGLTLGNTNATLRDCEYYENISGSLGAGISIFQNSGNDINDPIIHIISCIFDRNISNSSGAALWFNNFFPGSKLRLDGCLFTQNESMGRGGGLFVQNLRQDDATSLTLIINETEFIENLAVFAGAINCYANTDTFDILITNSKVISNACTGNNGGGILIDNSSQGIINARIENTNFMDNYSNGNGGGLKIDNSNWDNPIRFAIDECTFQGNATSGFGGAITSFGCYGAIQNTSFVDNFANGSSGAIDSGLDSLGIINCFFGNNYTQAIEEFYNGGGALLLWYYSDVFLTNIIFEGNVSDMNGSAVMLQDGAFARFENVLFDSNVGTNTIYNSDSISMLNVTMIDNDNGLLLNDGARGGTIQNCIFKNQANNLLYYSNPVLTSKGSNISNDASLAEFLTGYDNYLDYHEADPMLGPDFVPLEGSLCIDRGNPEGITTMYDLAGNNRIRGGNIDIGAYESDLVSSVKNIAGIRKELTVFPNPVYDVLSFYLENDWIGDLKLNIYDLQGKLMKEETSSKNELSQKYEIDVRFLSHGDYILLVTNGIESIRTPCIVLKP